MGEGRSYELVLADRTRVPVEAAMTIGRAPGSTLVLADGTVSREHARIRLDGDSLTLEDAGSSYGTWVDGRRVDGAVALREGTRIRVGEQELVVERRRRDSEAGLTVVVPAGATAAGTPDRPRLRSGYALKRLEASEGPRRWVLRDLRSERFLRLVDEDGRLLELVDGRRSILELVGEAERRVGPDGGPRMVRLLSELAERGFLDGAGADAAGPAPRPRGLQRLLAPHEWAWPGAGARLDEVYARGGWRLFTAPALIALAFVAIGGLAAFAYLVAGRYGTPFVVASKVGIGGIVFVVGRLAVAAVHETAHGLTMARFGRRVGRAGLKVVLIFPYAFVDTSEAWFEPRRRRIAVSAAGPASDAVLGGAFSLGCLVLGRGALRDICFQLAFGAWMGAVVNLNPFVQRDGYHILADALGEPALRRRARAELGRRLRGEASGAPSPVLVRYAVAGLVWSVVAAGIAIVVSLRYAPALRALLPAPVVVVLLMLAWAALLTPVLAVVAGPLREWIRRPRAAP
jgi:putative peptide zinc metalloprotease protein